MGPLAPEKVPPGTSGTGSRVSRWPRTSLTRQGPVRPGFQGTRPAPSERAFGAFQTTRSPGFRSTVRLCLLANLALAAELLSQWAFTAADSSANCLNCPRAHSVTGSNSRASRNTSLSKGRASDQLRSKSLGV